MRLQQAAVQEQVTVLGVEAERQDFMVMALAQVAGLVVLAMLALVVLVMAATATSMLQT
jgi:hypothetical protein